MTGIAERMREEMAALRDEERPPRQARDCPTFKACFGRVCGRWCSCGPCRCVYCREKAQRASGRGA